MMEWKCKHTHDMIFFHVLSILILRGGACNGIWFIVYSIVITHWSICVQTSKVERHFSFGCWAYDNFVLSSDWRRSTDYRSLTNWVPREDENTYDWDRLLSSFDSGISLCTRQLLPCVNEEGMQLHFLFIKMWIHKWSYLLW